MQRLKVLLPVSMLDALDRLATARGSTRSAEVRAALRPYLIAELPAAERDAAFLADIRTRAVEGGDA